MENSFQYIILPTPLEIKLPTSFHNIPPAVMINVENKNDHTLAPTEPAAAPAANGFLIKTDIHTAITILTINGIASLIIQLTKSSSQNFQGLSIISCILFIKF